MSSSADDRPLVDPGGGADVAVTHPVGPAAAAEAVALSPSASTGVMPQADVDRSGSSPAASPVGTAGVVPDLTRYSEHDTFRAAMEAWLDELPLQADYPAPQWNL